MLRPYPLPHLRVVMRCAWAACLELDTLARQKSTTYDDRLGRSSLTHIACAARLQRRSVEDLAVKALARPLHCPVASACHVSNVDPAQSDGRHFSALQYWHHAALSINS